MVNGEPHHAACPGCPLGPAIAAVKGDSGVAAQTRYVADLLAGGRHVRLAGDRGELAHVADRPLYRAVRDAIPERTVDGARWRSDLVWYLPGELPGGEPHRSIGHWNAPGQVEVFQVLEGSVGLVVADGEAGAHYRRCAPGDVLALPRGAWHLTYVLDGPALVFNAYGEADAEPDDAKYDRREPPAYTLQRTPAGTVPYSAAGTPLPRWPHGGGLTAVPDGACLARLLSTEDELLIKSLTRLV